MIKSIGLTNFLSYGSKGMRLGLGALNVIIGPNGAGKSNLIEALDLLRAAPKDLLTPIREGGGVRGWLWNESVSSPVAEIEAVVELTKQPELRYTLSFAEVGQRFRIEGERVEDALVAVGDSRPNRHYAFANGQGVLHIKGNERLLGEDELNPVESILAQRKDPDQYPALTQLGALFEKIRVYREWSFGRNMPARLPQKADLPNEHLEPGASNLGLVLNRLRREPAVKKKLLEALGALYAGIDDFDVQIEGGTVQVFLQEGARIVPAARLSDGTLRYLCLLAILCHPKPGPLICIEEPELGLHPDVLPTMARLLKEASERTQLIVTTHSDVLVDALSDVPESVVVAERGDEGSSLERLDAERLKPWLEKYRLGQLWTSGEIGGTRW